MIELKYNFLHWFKRHHFLYIFVFLINFKPIDSFFYEFLAISKNITQEQYREEIYPVSAYTAVALSVLISSLLGFCDFNYVLILGALGGLVASAFFWQVDTIIELQVAEGFRGCAVATEIICYVSIYVCHDNRKNFGHMSVYIRAAVLITKMVSAIVSQIMITNGWLDYQELAFLSIPAFVHCFLLIPHMPILSDGQKPPTAILPKITWFKNKFKETFSNTHVLKWSLWGAFTICGYIRVSALMQPFWKEGQLRSNEIPYNGTIYGIAAFLALLGVFLSGTVTTNMKHENIFLCVTSLLQSGLLFGVANVDSAWDSTIFYIILEIVYHFVMSFVFTMVAENVHRRGSFGMVFSFIGLVYLFINLIFVCVLNNNVVVLGIEDELMVYGGYYLVTALLMVLCCLLNL